jgi:hypothetical protein
MGVYGKGYHHYLTVNQDVTFRPCQSLETRSTKHALQTLLADLSEPGEYLCWRDDLATASDSTYNDVVRIIREGLGLKQIFHAAAGNHTSSRAKCVTLVRYVETVRNDLSQLADSRQPVEIRICTDLDSCIERIDQNLPYLCGQY